MKNWIIATEEGMTVSPYGRRCENPQILGFGIGNTKEEAIEDFIIHMEDEDFFEMEGWDKEKLIAYQLDDSELQ